MRSDDQEGVPWCPVEALEECTGGVEEGFDALEQRAMGNLPTVVVPPQYLDQIPSGTVGRQVDQDEAA